jgi:la-related protein 4
MAVLYFNIAEGTALLAALQKQIEFYFSRENLNKDQYLVSQMDSQMFVPVVTIQQVCGFVC